MLVVLADLFRDLWAEPAPEMPRRSRLDGVLIVALVAAGLADGLLSSEVAWPLITIPLMTALPLVLYWRHTHPVSVAAIVFGCYSVLHGAMLASGTASTFLNGGLIAATIYTLARWASGRQAIIGLLLAVAGTAIAGSTGVLREVAGAIGLPLFITLVLLLGVAMRLWSSRESARLSEAKMSERNRIARELHDTIAHHVSAIAIQAQGGQEILMTDPQAALGALAVIEREASLTLDEMRLILGVLRDDGPPDLRPNRGIEDIVRLADEREGSPKVEVSMSGDLKGLSPSVESALFRLAQEAVTNARRHGKHVRNVAVNVCGSDDGVRLRVSDDGQLVGQAKSGYGLLGMSERASLLGGECVAGPSRSGRGWIVSASLPRNVKST